VKCLYSLILIYLFLTKFTLVLLEENSREFYFNNFHLDLKVCLEDFMKNIKNEITFFKNNKFMHEIKMKTSKNYMLKFLLILI